MRRNVIELHGLIAGVMPGKERNERRGSLE